MKISQLAPHLRFAMALRYEMPYNNKPVKVTDCRVFYVTAGSALLTIDGTTYALEQDSLFYCCAGSRYTVQIREDFHLLCLNFDLSQQYQNVSLSISPSRDPNAWDTVPVYADPVEDSRILNSHLFLQNANHLKELIQKIVTDFSQDGELYRLLCCQRLTVLLLELHRSNQQRLPEKVQIVQEYIRTHYAEKMTNRDLADLVGYHEYYLNRLFLQCTGETLHEYLQKVRLTQALALITNTDLPLQSIAERSGFGSYPHFSASFKAACGLSPAQFRKKSNPVIDNNTENATISKGV